MPLLARQLVFDLWHVLYPRFTRDFKMGGWDILGAVNALLMAIDILHLQYEVCLQPIVSQNQIDHALDVDLEEANREVGE